MDARKEGGREGGRERERELGRKGGTEGKLRGIDGGRRRRGRGYVSGRSQKDTLPTPPPPYPHYEKNNDTAPGGETLWWRGREREWVLVRDGEWYGLQ